MNTKQTEARRQVAEQIAATAIGKVTPDVYREMVEVIIFALEAEARAQRERAAQIVLNRRWMFDEEVAAVIREGE